MNKSFTIIPVEHLIYVWFLQMSKQTIGVPAHALQFRMDTKLYKLQVCRTVDHKIHATAVQERILM